MNLLIQAPLSFDPRKKASDRRTVKRVDDAMSSHRILLGLGR